jgi:hypothetical protein
VAEYVEVAVVGAYLEEDVVLPVPMVKQFLDQILVSIQPKANWSLVNLVPGIAVYLYLHSRHFRTPGWYPSAARLQRKSSGRTHTSP